MALGSNNGYGDTQDLYVETIDPKNPDSYLEGDQSIPFNKIVETIRIKDNNTPEGFKNRKSTQSFLKPAINAYPYFFSKVAIKSVRTSTASNDTALYNEALQPPTER